MIELEDAGRAAQAALAVDVLDPELQITPESSKDLELGTDDGLRSAPPANQQVSPELDGMTFEVIVHRLRPRQSGGEWLVRVYQSGEHVHSAEGGVPLEVGLREAHDAMVGWLTGWGSFAAPLEGGGVAEAHSPGSVVVFPEEREAGLELRCACGWTGDSWAAAKTHVLSEMGHGGSVHDVAPVPVGEEER